MVQVCYYDFMSQGSYNFMDQHIPLKLFIKYSSDTSINLKINLFSCITISHLMQLTYAVSYTVMQKIFLH